MTWATCTLDQSPTGNLTIIDDSGYYFSAIVQTGNSDEINKFIAVAQQGRQVFIKSQGDVSTTAASILAQAQKAG